MKKLVLVSLSLSLVLAVLAGSGCSRKAEAREDGDLLVHGHYLVHRVAMCIDCHSPRDASGAFVPGRDLSGSPLGFGPLAPMPWMAAAPAIAGLPHGYTEESLAHYLMTGTRPHGLAPTLPPMPPYRMNARDAKAVAAYLASLKPAPPRR